MSKFKNFIVDLDPKVKALSAMAICIVLLLAILLPILISNTNDIPEQIIITFETDGGENISSLLIDSNYVLPDNLSREGYNFAGWYLTSDFSGEVITSISPGQGADTTIYAKWIPANYTLSFNTNEGSAISPLSISYQSDIILPDNPQKTGASFVGWFSDDELTSAFTLNKMPNYNITIHAKWHIIQYTITYNLNLGENNIDNPAFYTTEEAVILNSSSRTGYEFLGWYDNALFNGNAIANISAGSSGDKVLYARWSVRSYTLSFILFDGFPAMIPRTLEYGELLGALSAPSKDGYSFIGWAGDSQLQSTVNPAEFTMPAQNFTLYAKWTPETYTLTFDYQGATGGNTLNNKAITYLSTYGELPIPTKTVHTFLGWFTDPDAGEIVGSADTVNITSAITLYARWERYSTPGLNFVLINEDTEYRVSKGTVPAGTQVIVIPAIYNGLPVVYIGNNAFENITGLETIYIPETVSEIETDAFNGCSNLKHFALSVDNATFTLVNGVLFSADLLSLIRYPQAKEGINYDIPVGTETLEDYAFHGCSLLTEINIPDSITTLGYSCFSYTSITEIFIPENVEYIGQASFMFCNLLNNINVSNEHLEYFSVDGVVYYDEGRILAVYPTGRMDGEFYAPDGVEELSMGAFASTKVLYVYLPDGFKKFSMHNFLLSSAKGITVPSTVEDMSTYTLTGIEYINIFAETPPSIGGVVFNTNTLIYVPADYVDEYKTEWSTLAARIFAMPIVYFEAGEGLPVIPMTVGYNNRIGAIEGGYLADNYAVEWYTDELLEELFDYDTKITEDMTLYSKYVKLYSLGLEYIVYNTGEYNGYAVAKGDCEDSDIIIPAYHPDYPDIPVVAIASMGFTFASGIDSVILPSTMRVIGEFAFTFSSITSIYLNDGLIEIQGCAFERSKIIELYIPSSVSSIEGSAFHSSFSLVSVVLGDNGVITTIEGGVFAYCTSLVSVDFGLNNSITEIGPGVFNGCEKLTEILNLPNLTKIDYMAFNSCIALTEFIMPDTLEFIGFGAFSSCTGLTEISFVGLESLEIIEDNAFSLCDNLERVTFGGNTSLTIINSMLFLNCVELSSVDFGDTPITTINASAFQGCSLLTSIVLPDTLEVINSYAFADCESLSSVSFSYNGSLNNIGEYAFQNCISLEEIILPNTLIEIGQYAFYYCQGLINVVFEDDSIIETLIYTFEDCNNLVSVNFGSNHSLVSLEGSVFRNCTSLTDLLNIDGLVSIGEYAFENCTSLIVFNMPETLESISSGAFMDCTGLIEISFEGCNNLSELSDSVFYGCSGLVSVTLNDSLTVIASSLFRECDSLSEFNFGLNSNITNIGAYAFKDCGSLTSIDLPESLVEIGSYAFEGCNLSSIILPSGLTRINDYAFRSNTELTSVISLSIIPPNIINSFLDDTNVNLKIYVLKESLDDYKQSWSNYDEEIFALPEVTFESNGGTLIPSQSIILGEKAIRPDDPTKQDNTFMGWYSESELVNIYDFDTIINGDLTLFAKWV